jgi:hypothetical protein
MPTTAKPLASFTDKDKARFYSRIGPPDANGCTHWLLSRNPKGYGVMFCQEQLTHRVAWILKNGAIPAGRIVCHHCDTPSCCNVGHMYVGTHKDNARDKVMRGRCNAATGQRHGSKTKPDRVPRGARCGCFTKPERKARGERHGSKTKPDSIPKGERNGRAILTVELVREIRTKEGMSQSQIGLLYGIKQTTVSAIMRRVIWPDA